MTVGRAEKPGGRKDARLSTDAPEGFGPRAEEPGSECCTLLQRSHGRSRDAQRGLAPGGREESLQKCGMHNSLLKDMLVSTYYFRQ